MDERNITITLDDGRELLCEILFTYFSEEFRKNYVVFKVKATGEISAACFTEQDAKTGDISKVETEEEWELLEDLLQDYFDQNNCEGDCRGCSGCKPNDEE